MRVPNSLGQQLVELSVGIKLKSARKFWRGKICFRHSNHLANGDTLPQAPSSSFDRLQFANDKSR
jgi:hypothetical protein